MNEEKRPDKYSGYEPLDSIYGDDGNLYRLYRKVVEVNGDFHGLWAAAPHADDGSFDESKMFDITYAQARGFEPITETDIGKLRRTLGKKLLPQQESYDRKVMNKRRLSESYEDYGVDPDETAVYFFPQLDRDDMIFAKRFGLLFEEELSDEDTTALSGRFEDLVDFAEKYLDYQLVDGYLFDENGDEIWLNESLNESIPAKAKKEIAGWWKEVEAWNKKKKEFNISNDYNDVEGMHTAMFDMLDELKSRDKDLYEKGRKIYNKYSDVPIKKSKVREAYEDEFDDYEFDEDSARIATGIDGHKYIKSSSKRVHDSDGFITDYTAWIDLDNFEHVVFIFGDNDLYDPSNESPDWECDSSEEAQEWFDNYEGFDDEDDEDYYGESLNKSLTEADTLARNFKKDIKSRYKSWDARNDYKNSKRKELKKMLDSSNFPKDKANSIVDIMEPEEKPFEYELPKHLETKDFPFYVTYYEEHPYYHPEEGGYYVAGRYADYSEGFDSKEEAKQFARELANKEGLSRVNDTYYNKPSKYFGEEEHIWVETARDYLSHEKGDTPYE